MSEAAGIRIAVERIVPSPNNPRNITDASVEELAQSIREQGVLEPVLVRAHPKGGAGDYELLAGERRWRAAQLAGLAEVPANVHVLNDREALEVTVTENLQRQDLGPLEEAQGIRALLDGGADVRRVAARLGKSATWVVRRAKLTDLSPRWKKSAADPKHWASAWSARHLLVVARLTAKEQAHALAELTKYGRGERRMTVDDLTSSIGQSFHRLKAAPWKQGDETLLADAGACDACPKRTSYQPGLFAGWFDQTDPAESKAAAAKDRCLDGECWKRKMTAHLEARAAELKEADPKLILVNKAHYPEAREGALQVYSYKDVKKTAKGARRALVVSGPGAGTTCWVKRHGGSALKPKAARKGPTLLEERRRKLGRRRDALVIAAVRLALQDTEPGELLNELLGPEVEYERLIAFAATFGTGDLGGHWGNFDVLAADGKAGDLALLAEVLNVLATRLSPVPASYEHQMKQKMQEVEGACRVFGLNLDGYRAEAAAALPDPKSWARLNEDGTPKPASAKPSTAGKPKRKKRKGAKE